MKPNDILLAENVYSDMVYFLQVVKATKATVTVREIYACKSTGLPLVGEFKEYHEPMTKKVNDGRIRLSTWASARLWDGKPVHNEHPMWGLNYNLY